MSENYDYLNNNASKSAGLLPLLYIFLQFMNPICYITDALGMESRFALVSRLYIIVSFFAFLFYILQSRRVTSMFLNVLMLAGTTMLSYLISAGGISLYNFTITLAGFLALPIYMTIIPEIGFSKGLYRWTYLCNMITAVFFVYSGFLRPEYYMVSNALTMGFFNANQAAIFLVQNIAVLLCCYQYENNIIRKLIIVAICVIETYFTYLTQSRISIVCIAVLLFVHLKRDKYIPMKYVRLAFILPIIMVAAILYFSSNEKLLATEIFGKPIISGREKIYLSALLGMGGKWLFGNFGEYQLGNLHNAYLSVLVSIGIVGSILFLHFYWKAIKDLWNKHINSGISTVAYVAILLLFIQGSAEAASLVSGSMYAGASTAFLFFLNYEGEME